MAISKKECRIQEKFPDGSKQREQCGEFDGQDVLINGREVTWMEGGIRWITTTVQSYQKTKSTFWFPNGVRAVVVEFSDNQKDGWEIWRHESGALMKECLYQKGVLVKCQSPQYSNYP